MAENKKDKDNNQNPNVSQEQPNYLSKNKNTKQDQKQQPQTQAGIQKIQDILQQKSHSIQPNPVVEPQNLKTNYVEKYQDFFYEMMVDTIRQKYGQLKLKQYELPDESNLQLNGEKQLQNEKLPAQDDLSQENQHNKELQLLKLRKKKYNTKMVFQCGELANAEYIYQSVNTLKESGVRVDLDRDAEEKIQIVSIFDCSPNYKSMTILVKMGIFSTNFRLLSAQMDHHHQSPILGKGGQGKIFPVLKYGERCVIKCSPRDEEQQRQNHSFGQKKERTLIQKITYKNVIFLERLKQLFFCKIFSILKIGPQVKKVFGYDLVIFKNCFQFSMEQCQSVKAWNSRLNNDNVNVGTQIQVIQNNIGKYQQKRQPKNQTCNQSIKFIYQIKFNSKKQQMQRQQRAKQNFPLIKQKVDKRRRRQQLSIKKNAYLMHQLSIIHVDLKQDNILYSRSLDKIVFCDFGQTYCIDNKFGFKKKINHYRGTVQFSGQEMKKLFNQKTPRHIDLYHNDIACLQKFLTNSFIRHNYYKKIKYQKCEPIDQTCIFQAVFHLQGNNLSEALKCLLYNSLDTEPVPVFKDTQGKNNNKNAYIQVNYYVIQKKYVRQSIMFRVFQLASKVNITNATSQLLKKVLKENLNKRLLQNNIFKKNTQNLRQKIKIMSKRYLSNLNHNYDENPNCQKVNFFQKTAKLRLNINYHNQDKNKSFVYTKQMENILFDKQQAKKVYTQNREKYINVFLMSTLFKNSLFSSTLEQKSIAAQILIQILKQEPVIINHKKIEEECLQFLTDSNSKIPVQCIDQGQKYIIKSLFYILKLCQDFSQNLLSFNSAKSFQLNWKKNRLIQILQTFAYYGHFNEQYMKKMVNHIVKYSPKDYIYQISSLIRLKQIRFVIQFQYYDKRREIKKQFYQQYSQIEKKLLKQMDEKQQKMSHNQQKIVLLYIDITQCELKCNLTKEQLERLFYCLKQIINMQGTSQLQLYLRNLIFRKLKSWYNYQQENVLSTQNQLKNCNTDSTWLVHNKFIKKKNISFQKINEMFFVRSYDWEKLTILLEQFDNSIRNKNISYRYFLGIRIRIAFSKQNAYDNITGLIDHLVNSFDQQSSSDIFPLYQCLFTKLNFNVEIIINTSMFKTNQSYKFTTFKKEVLRLKQHCYNVACFILKQTQKQIQNLTESESSLTDKHPQFSVSYYLQRFDALFNFISLIDSTINVKKITAKQTQIIIQKYKELFKAKSQIGLYMFSKILNKNKRQSKLDVFQVMIMDNFNDLKRQYQLKRDQSYFQTLYSLNYFLSLFFKNHKYKQYPSDQMSQYVRQKICWTVIQSLKHYSFLIFIFYPHILKHIITFLLLDGQRFLQYQQFEKLFKQFQFPANQKGMIMENIKSKIKNKKTFNQKTMDKLVLFYGFLQIFTSSSFQISRVYEQIRGFYYHFYYLLYTCPSDLILSLSIVAIQKLRIHKASQFDLISPFFSVYLFPLVQGLIRLLSQRIIFTDIYLYDEQQRSSIRKLIIQFMQILQSLLSKPTSYNYYYREKLEIIKQIFDHIFCGFGKNLIQDIRVLYITYDKILNNNILYVAKCMQDINQFGEIQRQKVKQKKISIKLQNKMAQKLAQKLNLITYLRWDPIRYQKYKQNPRNRKLK